MKKVKKALVCSIDIILYHIGHSITLLSAFRFTIRFLPFYHISKSAEIAGFRRIPILRICGTNVKKGGTETEIPVPPKISSELSAGQVSIPQPADLRPFRPFLEQRHHSALISSLHELLHSIAGQRLHQRLDRRVILLALLNGYYVAVGHSRFGIRSLYRQSVGYL